MYVSVEIMRLSTSHFETHYLQKISAFIVFNAVDTNVELGSNGVLFLESPSGTGLGNDGLACGLGHDSGYFIQGI